MSLVTPSLIRLSYKLSFCEPISEHLERKIHTTPKPYLGGLGIFLCFWTVCIFSETIRSAVTEQLGIYFVCSLLVFISGTVDDIYKIHGSGLPALPKMLLQFIPCALAAVFGTRISGIPLPMASNFIYFPGFFQILITIIWLFGMITITNFMDGIDGLAGGIVCISSISLCIILHSKEYEVYSIMYMVLSGVCLGYLKNNLPPSKILMGDAGATFLGFILGVLILNTSFQKVTVMSYLIPIVSYGLPILDTIYVLAVRAIQKRPVYIGDTTQIHYRLLKRGYTPWQVIGILYSICGFLNVVSIVCDLVFQ